MKKRGKKGQTPSTLLWPFPGGKKGTDPFYTSMAFSGEKRQGKGDRPLLPRGRFRRRSGGRPRGRIRRPRGEKGTDPF